MKKFEKFPRRTIETGRLLTKLTNDTLHWSKPKYVFRVRLNHDYLKAFVPAFNYINPGFETMIESNTKARRFHGYLEGDYELATAGFYTNNAKGIARLVEKYPQMIKSIQTHDQYMFAVQLSGFLYDKVNEEDDQD